MSGRDENSEKEHEATQKRLDDARARGEVARSPEVTTAAAYGGLLLAAVVAGPASLAAITDIGGALLERPEAFAAQILGTGDGPAGGLLLASVGAVGALFLGPLVAVVVVLVAQRVLIFTPSKLAPKLSRVSILANAKNKFGRSGLFEFAKSFVKLIVVTAILAWFLSVRLEEIVIASALPPQLVSAKMMRLIVVFLLLVVAISGAIAAVDYLWQRAEHLRRNRMSRKDLTNEMKESEGDPHMKQKRRQRGYEIATRRMIADVAKTDVVIVNPTHYAVALKWSRSDRHAPICLAKGVDEVAARIREAAVAAGVPIHRDPPTAREIYAEVELGAEIQPGHYRAVAAAIRFAERMRKKAHGSWR